MVAINRIRHCRSRRGCIRLAGCQRAIVKEGAQQTVVGGVQDIVAGQIDAVAPLTAARCATSLVGYSPNYHSRRTGKDVARAPGLRDLQVRRGRQSDQERAEAAAAVVLITLAHGVSAVRHHVCVVIPRYAYGKRKGRRLSIALAGGQIGGIGGRAEQGGCRHIQRSVRADVYAIVPGGGSCSPLTPVGHDPFDLQGLAGKCRGGRADCLHRHVRQCLGCKRPFLAGTETGTVAGDYLPVISGGGIQVTGWLVACRPGATKDFGRRPWFELPVLPEIEIIADSADDPAQRSVLLI